MSWPEVEARIRAGVFSAAGKAALLMEREAIRLAPKGVSEPGLDKSIYSESKDEASVITARCWCDAPHARYIEEGTGPAAGHARYMPPPGALRQWVQRKLGIVPLFAGKFGRSGLGDSAIRDVERLIRWKIYMKGTEAQPFMAPAYQKVAPKWRDMLKQALKEAIRG